MIELFVLHVGPPPDIVIEFEAILTALDTLTCTPEQWVRFKEVLAEATLAACDAETGGVAYRRMLDEWRRCPLYDGED
jgi:hypothetical protein